MTEPEQSDEQPEEPDLGAAVQLESGETLDGNPGTDGLDAGYVAPNRPFFLDVNATTADGQRAGETLDQRLLQEIPDDLQDAASGPAPDQTEGEIGSEAGQGRSGRLAADAVSADLQTTGSMEADDMGISGGAASAEEAAMHDIDEDEIDGVSDLVDPMSPEVPEGPDVRLRSDEIDPAGIAPADADPTDTELMETELATTGPVRAGTAGTGTAEVDPMDVDPANEIDPAE